MVAHAAREVSFEAAEPPRSGVVVLGEGRSATRMSVRDALPWLLRAGVEAPPSVQELAAAGLAGLRLVASGRFEPAEDHWRPTVDDVAAFTAAVVDALPDRPPAPTREAAHMVRIALRIEADEEELLAGSVRVVPQVHDEQDPLRFCDAALLWTDDGGDPRLRRPGPHPRRPRPAPGGRRVAGPRPAARAAGPRPDHPGHRRAGQPARRRRRRPGRQRRRRAVAAQPGSRPDRPRGARPTRQGAARGAAADRAADAGRPVRLQLADRGPW